MPDILVTGGAGYIGGHIVYELLDSGYDVAVADDLSSGNRDVLPPSVQFFHGDIGHAAFIGRVLDVSRPKSVIHCAGSILVDESIRDPALYYRNNATASLTLLEQCVKAGVTFFVFSSSASVYGVPDSIPVPEDATLHPISPYGWSKLFTEQQIRDFSRAYGLRHAILRYFNVAGADPGGRTGQGSRVVSHLLKIACQAALGLRECVEIFGVDYNTPDGSCIRDFVHVSDLANAHRMVLEFCHSHNANVTFNCGNGQGYSVLEVIRAVEAVCGHSIKVKHCDRRLGDPARLVADPSALMRELSWTPRFGELKDMIVTALDWEKAHSFSRKLHLGT